jgi:DNA repair protein RecN (Recombination protein N)
MGEIMKEMSQTMQNICHYPPQIAAKLARHAHFKVSNNGDTSELKLLTDEERIIEIAQMLSGAVVSDSALNHALVKLVFWLYLFPL